MKKTLYMWLVFSLCFFAISFSIVSSAETEVQTAEIPEYMKASNVFTEEQLEDLYSAQDRIPFNVDKIHEYRVLPIYCILPRSYYAYWERSLEYNMELVSVENYVVFSNDECFCITYRGSSKNSDDRKFYNSHDWEYAAATAGLMPAEYRSIAPQMYLDGAMRNVNNAVVLGNLEHGIFSIYYLTDGGTFIKHFERSDPEGVVDQSALFTEEKFRELRSILYTDLRENLDYYAQLSKETGMVYVGCGASPFYQLAEEAGIEIEYAPPGNPIPEHLQPKAEQKTTAPAKQASRTGWLIGCVAAGVLGIAAMTVPVLLRRTSLKKE